MKVHEFQAKEVLRRFGAPTPRGEVARTPEDAREAAEKLGGGTVIVKAQIHAGGRGKGGGIRLAKNPDEAENAAGDIIGMDLVTHQTGPAGRRVKFVLVEEGMSIDHEYYVGIVIDRCTERPVVMASREGGMEIEVVAAKNPEAILKEYVNPAIGLCDYQARRLAFGLGFEGKQARRAAGFISGLYNAFESMDASIAEINPLVTTTDSRILALDAKIGFDDNALFRHKELLEYRDLDEEEPLEVEASKYDLNYIKLDGSIGCMVNGAGLAMATMDIIQLYGAMPANFLDVGGGATPERVAQAFRILTSDNNVKAILVNIFGGIVRCDKVASGILEAIKTMKVDLPMVVRLKGTNSEEGLRLLLNSGLNIKTAEGLSDAAEKVVAAAGGGR